MKKRKIDWNRHVPLGMDGEKVKNRMAALLGVGIGGSLLCPLRYAQARAELFWYMNGKYQRRTRTKMVPFEELLSGSFIVMAIAAVGFVLAMAVFYLYHYQGSRGIYTMRRLPSRWELWRRCVTLPVLFLVLSILCTAVLIGLYYLLWRYATPPDAFPL